MGTGESGPLGVPAALRVLKDPEEETGPVIHPLLHVEDRLRGRLLDDDRPMGAVIQPVDDPDLWDGEFASRRPVRPPDPEEEGDEVLPQLLRHRPPLRLVDLPLVFGYREN